MVSCDTHRPAAIEQLATLANNRTDFYPAEVDQKPPTSPLPPGLGDASTTKS